MKKQIYTFIGLIIVLTISSVTAIHAQSATTGRARIPFDFSVRNQTISAGDYLIKRQNDSGRAWSLRHSDNRQSVIFLATSVGSQITSGNGKMTFRRYGNKYFLASLEMSNYKIGLRKSRAERSLEKQLENNDRLAKNNVNGAKPEIVAVKLAM